MIEAAAEANDTLMHKYLEGEAALREGDHARVCARARSRTRSCLCMCGTAFKNKGVQALLDAVIEFMPCPSRCPDVKGLNDRGETERARASDEAPFSALAFKILTDPFVGKLIFFRVYSGALNRATPCTMPTKDKKERIGRLLQMHANERTRSRKFAPATSPRPWA